MRPDGRQPDQLRPFSLERGFAKFAEGSCLVKMGETHMLVTVSVGIYRGQEILDLNYDEDSQAETDMNVVMTESGKFIEIQGTAEQDPFGIETLGRMLKLAQKGIFELVKAQKQALGI